MRVDIIHRLRRYAGGCASARPPSRSSSVYEARTEPIKQRYGRCEHPSGPHPMHTPCSWFAAKAEGSP